MPSLADCPRPPTPSSSPHSFPNAFTHSSACPPRGNGRSTNIVPQSSTSRATPSPSRDTQSAALASSSRMGMAVNKIEQIMETVLDNIIRGTELTIPFSRRTRPRARVASRDGDAARQQPCGFVSFPGKTEAEGKLFNKATTDEAKSKGYPTLVTRSFLHHIHETAPRLPIYGLVDYDPHGLRIFRTYKYGSQSLSHEANTTVPGMKWLGIQSCDLFCPRNSVGARHTWSALNDVLPLTDTDRRTAVCLLKDMIYGAKADSDAASLEQYREVQVMLMLNIKAEIQAADDYGDLATWLDEKLYQDQEGGLDII
ncbi:hypothetical protein SPBR_04867 [Sporothrix brasiliensis 5110]|uniref:Topoisomerase 6 subunit A/Spo11 TOPRIM domain-containing protein n=1 Tax=Sporothrix brasiliensis 5110 TaxID=1398154 RepID=A0A0C2IJM7_9PEZI|nr:uncharacterized protein SPBR_04867 [Sporothrix brasiliensis 5110]KIH87130.1 hypothetical protein SPBR_04867 [Sporothrix brasiliensis 5110]